MAAIWHEVNKMTVYVNGVPRNMEFYNTNPVANAGTVGQWIYYDPGTNFHKIVMFGCETTYGSYALRTVMDTGKNGSYYTNYGPFS